MKKKKNLEAEEQNIENEEPELDGKSEIGGDSETDDDLDDGEDPESDDESDDSGDSGLDDDLDDSEDSELADNSEPGGASEVEETPARQKRPYEDYVIEDPEDMDDAPDTVTIHTDRFSAYAIAYKQVSRTPQVGKCSLCHICPTFLGICYFVWLMVIITVLLIIWIVIRRKKNAKV